MRVIVTSGGTQEHIDDVRTITNTSSGRLGQLIAEACIGAGFDVDYIHGRGAKMPDAEVNAYSIEGTQSLYDTLMKRLEDPSVCAVVHAMAVSDYTVSAVTNISMLSDVLAEKRHDEVESLLANYTSGFDRNQKISSKEEGLVVMMKQAPKVIRQIKKQRPDILLIGFKLLVDVTEDHLIEVGYTLLKDNKCDYVLANDKSLIHDDVHQGYLINRHKEVVKYETKQEIAKGIVDTISKGVTNT